MGDLEQGRTPDVHNSGLFQYPERISKGGTPDELEMSMPEETTQQMDAKIKAEVKQADRLNKEADKEYPGIHVIDDTDANPSTPPEEIDEHGVYDPRLRQKAGRLLADSERVRLKYESLVDNNIAKMQEKQRSEAVKTYAASISKEARTIANYLRSLKRVRRRKTAGLTGGSKAPKLT